MAQTFLRWSLNLPDALVLLAETERLAYHNFKSGRRVVVIPNAVAQDGGVKTKNFDVLPVRLGYIGRLAHDKGVLETIHALKILIQSGFDHIELNIAGSGPYQAELAQAVRRLDLGASIRFLGPIFGEEKDRFWQETHVFVFPTFHDEGLPYAVLEAMASGTPTITTRVGGNPDVITDGQEGLLIDSHDPETVAAAIMALVSDANLLRNMSSAALGRARENYGIDRLSRQFDELYRELLSLP